VKASRRQASRRLASVASVESYGVSQVGLVIIMLRSVLRKNEDDARIYGNCASRPRFGTVLPSVFAPVSGGWGSCYAVGGCGEGRRERLVWCSEADGRTVLEVMCDPHSEPPTSKPCFTACRHHRGKCLP
jgi:hypothetical protein